jgi:CRISPR type I-E-associated protein CasB/Cse2
MTTAMTAHHKFIAHLERFVREKDRGALATLRRGLGKIPGAVREMDRYVLPALPTEVTGRQEDAFYLIGMLFACWYQGRDNIVENPPANLGESLRLLVNHEAAETGNREDAEKRVEKRLVALLNCHRDDLSEHLRYIIRLFKSNDIPVHWTQLLWDIQGWQQENRNVQRKWARYFWRNYTEKVRPEPGNTDPGKENNTEE